VTDVILQLGMGMGNSTLHHALAMILALSVCSMTPSSHAALAPAHAPAGIREGIWRSGSFWTLFRCLDGDGVGKARRAVQLREPFTLRVEGTSAQAAVPPFLPSRLLVPPLWLR